MASRKQNAVGKASVASKAKPAKEPARSKQQRMIDMLRGTGTEVASFACCFRGKGGQ
jgi:hypothetical protein